jgi:hypothetical protein
MRSEILGSVIKEEKEPVEVTSDIRHTGGKVVTLLQRYFKGSNL